MNILYVLGNGFDINLKLESSYERFLEYYTNRPSDNVSVIELKKEISKDIKSWSQLEYALGGYTEEFDNPLEFENIYDDIVENLVAYLKSQEDEFLGYLGKLNSRKILDDFFNPASRLRLAEKIDFIDFCKSKNNSTGSLGIMTFNYTNIFEKIMEKAGVEYEEELEIDCCNSKFMTVSRPLHVHGTLERDLVMGVNSIDQIKKASFRSDENFTNAFVKPKTNRMQGHMVDQECVKMIQSADVICVFGASIGETDKHWWDLISNRINTTRVKLLVFDVIDTVYPLQSHKNLRNENAVKDKLNINSAVRKNVHVVLNSDMFKSEFPSHPPLIFD